MAIITWYEINVYMGGYAQCSWELGVQRILRKTYVACESAKQKHEQRVGMKIERRKYMSGKT
jgi:hypothetical protein